MARERGSIAIVLVVEDEPLQRMDMIDMAERAGFEVLEAQDADHAIALLERRTDVRLVLADIDMPGTMNGLRLAAAVRRRWPPISIILTTAGVAPRRDEMPDDAVFLPKPLNYQRVVDTMHRMTA
ncbi:response regulator [Sphingomonas dokdonensis]|uniref:Blue-light-activated protein n=1 Tax=Sphingomonas dokdonensis TaxID=344880 RepID=A0A245ZCU0_9SPHN|nr:response regulator [Sphingomonas dokdonensis]OWK27511.1 blue-light-activated protein [Sphingomonas dokdonensis]